MRHDSAPRDDAALEPYRDYLRLLASHQLGPRLRGKMDLSGVVQETLFEAHREIARGAKVPPNEHLPWLRRILANNLADQARRLTAGKRDVGREVSLQESIELSSQRLEEWLANAKPASLSEGKEEPPFGLLAA